MFFVLVGAVAPYGAIGKPIRAYPHYSITASTSSSRKII